MKRATIGDVIVFRGMPEDGNPYRSHKSANPSLCGEERAAALLAFARGEPCEEFTFWHAPYSGGARRILDSDEVSWRTCRGAEERAARQD